MKRRAFVGLTSSGFMWLLLATASGCDGKSDDGRPQEGLIPPERVFLSLVSPKHLATAVKPDSSIQLRILGHRSPETVAEIEVAVSIVKVGGSAVTGKFTVARSTEVGHPYFATFRPDEPLTPGDYLVTVKPNGHVEIRKGVEQQYLFSVGEAPPRVSAVFLGTKNGETLSGGVIEFSERVQIVDSGVLSSVGGLQMDLDDRSAHLEDPTIYDGISLVFNNGTKITDTVKLTFLRSKVRSIDRRIGIGALQPELSTPNGAAKVTVSEDSVEIEIRPADLGSCDNSAFCWEPRTSVVK